MPDLTFLSSWTQEVEMLSSESAAFLSSWTQEVELTRCRISPSCLLGPKKSRLRDAGSRLVLSS